MSWINDYQYTSDYNIAFDVPDGEHRMLILSAKETTSKKGVPMIEVELRVNDSNLMPYTERIVAGEWFDKNMSRFFDAFKIVRGNFNFTSWRGKTARGMFKHEQQTYTDFYGAQKTVNKAVMSMLIVEQANAQGTGLAQTAQTPQSLPPQTPLQTPPAQSQAQSQAYGQPQAPAPAQAQGQSANMDDFPEDIPF